MDQLFSVSETYEKELALQKASQKEARQLDPNGKRERKVRKDQTLGKRCPW